MRTDAAQALWSRQFITDASLFMTASKLLFLFKIATQRIFFLKKGKKQKSTSSGRAESTASGCALPCCDCFGCLCTRRSFTSKRASYKLLEWLSCTAVGGQSAASTVGQHGTSWSNNQTSRSMPLRRRKRKV